MLQEITPHRGRPTSKFTLANIQKIKDWVAEGISRDEIAKSLDVTVGSLQVTCSRLGISLRKLNGYPCSRSRTEPVGSSAYAKHIGMASATLPKFEIVLQYRGATHTTILPLTDSDIARLGVEASVQDSSMVRLMTEVVAGAIKRKMIQKILQKDIFVSDA
jgi:DNA-binding CsgD family transcriptional regulator